MSWWDEYLELLHDPAHLMLELTMILVFDVVIGAVLWPLIKRAVRRHDKEHHPEERSGTYCPECWAYFPHNPLDDSFYESHYQWHIRSGHVDTDSCQQAG